MPVNNFEFEKAEGIISSIKGQSVGRNPISAAAIFNFVSIAQKGFGYKPEEVEMFIIHEADDVLDKTWQEIFDAMTDGKIVLIVHPSENLVNYEYVLLAKYDPDDSPCCTVRTTDSGHWYESSTLDDYPVFAN